MATTYPLPGVWPGALQLFEQFRSYNFHGVGLGTHTANEVFIYTSSYTSYDYSAWVYYIHVMLAMGVLPTVQGYQELNGITYAAVYYAQTYPNIRAFDWI